MNTTVPNAPENSTSTAKSKKHYIFLWLGTNAVIWSIALLYLALRPSSYKSQWSINLPATTPKTSVSVPNIGQASSWNESPYRSFADPRENYKFLAESDEVLEAAANQIKMPVEKFGKPKIKIIDNTTLMRFEIKGNTPQQAQQKALALQNALQTIIDKLRIQEVSQQDGILAQSISGDEQKLQAAKQRLYAYKATATLNSSQQLRDLTTNLEGMRRQKSETVAQLKQVTAKMRQMSVSLGLSPQEAADALVLQSDKLFQQYLANYSQASADLLNLSAKYLPANPVVITKQQAKDSAEAALLQHGQRLLGRPVSTITLRQLMLSGGGSTESYSERARLLQELISLQTQQQGMLAQVEELDQQIAQLESRLKILSQQESKLDNLERDVKIAEAVFSSNLTKLNLSKSDVSSSYPQFSIITPPNLPKKSSNPSPLLVLLGTGICSIFLTTGTVTLWMRDRKQQQPKYIDWKPSTNSTNNSNSSNSLDSLNSVSSKK
ncbi:MAG: hypothetical protein VKL59_20530 [Nostocaceae cyanobacterium]|nr:hypothetical protein [Nostocaceae cyanobacterium]